MAFTLDKIAGNGSTKVIVTADKNDTDSKKSGHLLIKVGGVVKQSISLVQAAGVGYELYIQVDRKYVPWSGGEVKVTYWITFNDDMTEEVPEITGIKNKISSGVNTDSDGKHWFIDKLPEGFREVTYVATYKNLQERVSVIGKDKNELILQIDRSYINEENPTAKITYWLLVNGKDISLGNLSLGYDEQGTEIEKYLTFGNIIDDTTTGKHYQTVTLSKLLPDSSQLTFYLINLNSGQKSGKVVLNLLSKNSYVLESVDFLTIKPQWSSDEGNSFDPILNVIDSSIDVGVNGKTLDDYFIGNGGNGNNLEEVKKYISKIGNLSRSVEGSIGINWKAIEEKAKKLKKSKVQAYLYGNWMDSKGTGLIDLNITSYQGNSLNPSDSDYIPSGDTVVSGSLQKSVKCHAFGVANFTFTDLNGIKQNYSSLLSMKFDITNHVLILEILNKKTGRSIEPEVKLNGELLKFSGLGQVSKTIQVSANEPNRIYNYNWTDAKAVVDNSSTINNLPMKVTTLPRVDSDFIQVVDTITKPGTNEITGIRFKAKPNTSDFRPRFAKMLINFSFDLQSPKVVLLVLDIIQPKA